MATTFSLAYQNTPDDFQKRVYAQLHAQSIAIAAALALAARHDKHSEALAHQQVRIRELEQTDRILPIDARDRQFAESHLMDIFTEARKILAVEMPWDKEAEA